MSFTIHGIDKAVDERLAERARRERISKNRLVKQLLARAVGLASPDGERDDYREFVGRWTPADREEFDRAQADNRQIHPGDWS